MAKALTTHPWITEALRGSRLIIVAGTTNGYVAEEILAHIGQAVGFVRRRFFRGVTLPPALVARMASRPPDSSGFPGDVVIDKGVWQRAKTVFEVIDELGPDDVMLKGANALDVAGGHAASFIDHPDAGPAGAILPAVLGRHIKLLIPVGLEKRVSGNLLDLCSALDGTDAKGPRLCPMPGKVFTEIDAISLLTGASATLVGAGGVAGAEGSVWLAVEGSADQHGKVEALMRQVLAEPAFNLELAG
jgi:hypothetical protein